MRAQCTIVPAPNSEPPDKKMRRRDRKVVWLVRTYTHVNKGWPYHLSGAKERIAAKQA